MMDTAVEQQLQAIYRRESRSFLQYIHEATPWASPADAALVTLVHRLANDELETLAAFAVWLDRERVPLPYLGAFSTGFASFNFVGVRTLLRELVPRQRQEIALLEKEAATLTGEAQTQVNGLLELNRTQLLELLPLVEASAKPRAAETKR